MVAQMHPQATVAGLTGRSSRGHEEIKANVRRMVESEQRYADEYLTAAAVEASARFIGDGEVAVADGGMEDRASPSRGRRSS